MYRLFSAGVVLLWVSAMTALFVRDIWPAWSAQDVPALTKAEVADLSHREEQFAILRVGDNARLGTAWSDLRVTSEHTSIRGTIAVHAQGLLPSLRIETETEFDASGGLDSFGLRVHGLQMRIYVRGERRGIYFPVEMHFGTFHREANLDMAATRMIGDSMRPFTFLPTLRVGQSWRMQILDPIAAAIGGKTQFRSIVARVVRTETIEHNGEQVECFVVETSPQQIVAWVDRTGRVLVQELEVPGFGRIRVCEEPYNEKARTSVQNSIKGSREP